MEINQRLRKWSFRNVYTIEKYSVQVPHLCHIHKVHIVDCPKQRQSSMKVCSSRWSVNFWFYLNGYADDL